MEKKHFIQVVNHTFNKQPGILIQYRLINLIDVLDGQFTILMRQGYLVTVHQVKKHIKSKTTAYQVRGKWEYNGLFGKD